MRARSVPGAARPRPHGADVRLGRSPRTRSSRATSTAGQWGVAVESKFLAVGSVVPWAEPDAGAVATQSYANPRYGPDGLALLRQGLSAAEVVQRLTDADDGRAQRQLGVVDAVGAAASFTGEACHEWAGGRTGAGYAAQGNLLVSGRHRGRARRDLRDGHGLARGAPAREPRRRAGGRAATAAASSRPRSWSSSATAATRGLSDVLVDLRVDDHEAPVEELRRLFGLHDELFGKTPREEWLPGRRRAARGDPGASRQARLRAARGLGRGREPGGARRRRRRDRPGGAQRR